MKKINKHSKYKNTGVLFELLVRQITNDTLNSVKKSPATRILEEFFNKRTTIRKEMHLYHTLQNQKFDTEAKANRFIDAVIKEFKKINKTSLRKEKYNLIKEIKKNYSLENFFKTKISNYRMNASISKTLDSDYNQPADKIRSRYTIIESITGKKVTKNTIEADVLKEYKKTDKDLRVLSYKILLEKFNSKYGNLSVGQRKLLREYINNVSNTERLKKYSNSEIDKLNIVLSKLAPKVKSKIVGIKINEVVSQLDKIKSEKKIKDIHLVSLLRSYDLIKEIKNVSK